MAEQLDIERGPCDSGSGWWNPWRWPVGIWALVIGAVLMLLPFGIRAVMLLGVPSIPEPFDIAEFSQWDVPASEDAFTDYRAAGTLRSQVAESLPVKSRQGPQSVSAVLESGWSASDEDLKEWLKAYREPLAVWRLGTEKRHGLNQRPDTLALDTIIMIIQDQRFFCQMALCEHARAQSESKYDESYQWARAAFRSGGHCSHRGCLIQALVAAANHAMACKGLEQWSGQPAVTEEQLRKALTAARSDFQLYELRSNILKAEYLAVRNSLASSRWLLVTGTGSPPSSNAAVAELMRMGYWVVGEPELSARLFRQMLANQIGEVDKPIASRRKQAGMGMAVLFDPDPAIPLPPGQLDPARIDQGIKRSLVLQALAPSVKQVDTALLRQEARQRALEAMLALQAYRRRHGEFPESLEALVPDYLDVVPLDPFDPAGGTLSFRRDTAMQAVVWSVGDDEVNSEGEVEAKEGAAADVGFLLR